MKAETIPHVNTEPASLNILLPIPKINPSLFPSKAHDVNELAKPEIGIKAPAPKNWANLSNFQKAVRSAVPRIITTIVTETAISFFRSKKSTKVCIRNCARTAKIPPPKKAVIAFLILCCFGL